MEPSEEPGQDQLLLEFRHNWHRELEGKTTIETYQRKGCDTSQPGTSSSNQGSLFDLKPGAIAFPKVTDKDPHSANKTVDILSKDNVCSPASSDPLKSQTVYYPFSIVDKFLNRSASYGNNINIQNEKKKHSSEKRKHSEGVAHAKKFKYRRNFSDLFSEKQTGSLPDERLLDRLIADIDEITEIPFFDISIPREVAIKIFQYLNKEEMCLCSQVSKSWSSLAEDELLWCRICHRLGQETIYSTAEKQNWKQIVQHNVERRRTLVTNWKGRVGRLEQLDHTKGKVLCAVDSWDNFVVAGYTNGHVKLWDLSTDDSCIFQPSNSSLLVTDDIDGTVPNIVNSVVTSPAYTAAAYSHGNVDIWSLESGIQPMQTYKHACPQFSISGLCLAKTSPTLAVAYGPYIDLLYKDRSEEEFRILHHVDCRTEVTNAKLFENSDAVPAVVFSTSFIVSMYRPHPPTGKLIGSPGHVRSNMTEIHNLIGAPVDVIDLKTDPALLAVGLGSYGGLMDGYRV